MQIKGLLAVALVSGSILMGTSASSVALTAKQIETASSVDELVALGATKLSAQQFKSMVVGKTLTGEGWTWIIDSDGTTSSAADDGSWKEESVPWNMDGSAYCSGAEGCRDVYLIGNYLRMSSKSDPTKLSPWTANFEK